MKKGCYCWNKQINIFFYVFILNNGFELITCFTSPLRGSIYVWQIESNRNPYLATNIPFEYKFFIEHIGQIWFKSRKATFTCLVGNHQMTWYSLNKAMRSIHWSDWCAPLTNFRSQEFIDKHEHSMHIDHRAHGQFMRLPISTSCFSCFLFLPCFFFWLCGSQWNLGRLCM